MYVVLHTYCLLCSSVNYSYRSCPPTVLQRNLVGACGVARYMNSKASSTSLRVRVEHCTVAPDFAHKIGTTPWIKPKINASLLTRLLLPPLLTVRINICVRLRQINHPPTTFLTMVYKLNASSDRYVSVCIHSGCTDFGKLQFFCWYKINQNCCCLLSHAQRDENNRNCYYV